MKKVLVCLLLIKMLVLTGCSAQKDTQLNQTDTVSPTIITNIEISSNPNTQEEYYVFDVSKEWDADEYKKTYGQELNSFNAPIFSPYKYMYKTEKKDMTIDEIAGKLGEVMMEDLKCDYEGKTFTVTEYHDLVAYVMNQEECKEWTDHYSKLIKKIVIKENQWICTFSCNYKYTGEYAGIGEMPTDWDWINTLTTDGSGENHVFIIQKDDDDVYIMRALSKSVMEIGNE